jgi:hypothetical protein
MRFHVYEVRDGQIEMSGGSSETELNELTIRPRGSRPIVAVTNATPVANLESASRRMPADSAVAELCEWACDIGCQ